MHRTLHLAVLVLALTLLCGANSYGAELIVFDSPYCEWCERWEEDVGVIYNKTEEASLAGLRRIDIDAVPAELRKLEPIGYTPTFVLMDRGREVGRIVGYQGEEFFWGKLGVLLKRLPSAN